MYCGAPDLASQALKTCEAICDENGLPRPEGWDKHYDLLKTLAVGKFCVWFTDASNKTANAKTKYDATSFRADLAKEMQKLAG